MVGRGRLAQMCKLVKFLKDTREVLITASAVLAAAVVVVETYQALKKKVDSGG